MKLDRHTRKLFHDDPYLMQATVRVVKVGPDFLELDATVAFPEGGGQEADTGTLTLDDGRTLRFDGATKMYGHPSGLAEFPDVQLDGVIWHRIVEADRAALATVQPGQAVTVAIDVERRARLTLSHTASHLLYLGIAAHRPDAIGETLGCHIKTDGARFDFSVAERFTPEDLARIEATANAYVRRDATVTVSAHPTAPDARLWHCEGRTIPCGGTHLDHTAAIGPITVRRRGLGTGKERLSCSFDAAVPELDRYHR